MTAILTVGPDASYKEVVRLMLSHRADALLVVEPGDRRLVGIITEADLLGREAFAAMDPGDLALLWEESTGWGAEWVGRALALRAADLMSRDITWVAPQAPVAQAARLMLTRGVKHLPVIDRREVVGMVSRRDLLGLFDRPDSQVSGQLDDILTAGPLTSAGCTTVTVQDGVATVACPGVPERERHAVTRRMAELPGVVSVRTRDGEAPPQPPAHQPPAHQPPAHQPPA